MSKRLAMNGSRMSASILLMDGVGLPQIPWRRRVLAERPYGGSLSVAVDKSDANESQIFRGGIPLFSVWKRHISFEFLFQIHTFVIVTYLLG